MAMLIEQFFDSISDGIDSVDVPVFRGLLEIFMFLFLFLLFLWFVKGYVAFLWGGFFEWELRTFILVIWAVLEFANHIGQQ